MLLNRTAERLGDDSLRYPGNTILVPPSKQVGQQPKRTLENCHQQLISRIGESFAAEKPAAGASTGSAAGEESLVIVRNEQVPRMHKARNEKEIRFCLFMVLSHQVTAVAPFPILCLLPNSIRPATLDSLARTQGYWASVARKY